MSTLSDQQERCLDPARNIIIEACAGSGKTWLLTSRLIRILLAEPKLEPNKILAITFTNAAAAEIDSRLTERIAAFEAADDDQQLNALLTQIGAKPTADIRQIARQLRRRSLLSRPRLAARTFHGWFNHIGQGLPWADRPVLTAQIAADISMLRNRAWHACIDMAVSDSKIAAALQHLLLRHKPPELKQILDSLLDHRIAWEMMFGVGPEDAAAGDQFLAKLDEAAPAEPQPKDLLHSAQFSKRIKTLLKSTQNAPRPQYMVKFISALQKIDQDKTALNDLELAVFTQKGKGKPVKNLIHKMDGHAEFTELLADLLHCRLWQQWQVIRPYNANVVTLGAAYAQAYAQAKLIHGAVDYVDLELNALRAMRNEATAAALLSGSDNAFAHILIDEFQDTSPSQWEIMRSWLNTAHGSDQQPSVFIVGDPKQSIYSFQGGDPEVMNVASDYLQSKYQACYEKFNTTRRCCPTVVTAVNATFGADGEKLNGFVDHATTQRDLAGQVLIANEQTMPPSVAKSNVLRNPLVEPVADPQASGAQLEGAQLSELIKHILGNWTINDGTLRRYRLDDIMLLFPRRIGAETITQELRHAQLPCAPLSGDNRLHYLECRDLIALLQAIYDPANGLALIHVLRSPIFSIDENDIWAVFSAGRNKDSKITRCNWYRGLIKAQGSSQLQRARQMLATWRKLYLYGKLPAHEMLARCFHDADIVNRYAKALPVQLRRRAVLNLQWLLNYAIEADGGHHVQLADYVQHLLQLSEQSSLRDTAEQPAGMIRTCTVHGAKGLESPIVIVVNSNALERNKSDQLLLRWENDSATGMRIPVHFSFFPQQQYMLPIQLSCKEDNHKANRREFLNMMYVAMTRAQQVLGLTVRPQKQNRAGLNWYAQARKALIRIDAQLTDAYLVLGDKPSGNLYAPDESPGDSTNPAVDFSSDAVQTLPENPLRHGKLNQYPSEQMRYGTLLHLLLSLQLSGLTEPDEQLGYLGIDRKSFTKLHKHAQRILASEQLAALLKASVRCEVEVPVDDNKDELRIDCLLDTGDTVWVLDFKSARQPDSGRYHAQLKKYRTAVENSGEQRPVKIALVGGAGELTEL